MPSENTARWGRRQSRQASGGADGFAVSGQPLPELSQKTWLRCTPRVIEALKLFGIKRA
jgi:hypothetical protein